MVRVLENVTQKFIDYILQKPIIVVLAGDQGGGKSALAGTIAELFHEKYPLGIVGWYGDLDKICPVDNDHWFRVTGMKPLPPLSRQMFHIVDEMGSNVSSRRASSKENVLWASFSYEHRHYRAWVIPIAVRIKALDIAIRDVRNVKIVKRLTAPDQLNYIRETWRWDDSIVNTLNSLDDDEAIVQFPDMTGGIIYNDLPSFWDQNYSRHDQEFDKIVHENRQKILPTIIDGEIDPDLEAELDLNEKPKKLRGKKNQIWDKNAPTIR